MKDHTPESIASLEHAVSVFVTIQGVATLTMVISVILYKILIQGTKWSFHIWVQFAMILICFSCFLIFNSYCVSVQRDSSYVAGFFLDAELWTKWAQSAYFIAYFFYQTQHWVFAVSYLEIAVIFKLAFSFDVTAA